MKNENIYIYENFKELLSLIAYLITNQIKPYNIQKKEKVTPNLFTNLIHLDTHTYQQFWNKKLSLKVLTLIKDAYRSEDKYKELAIYYVLLNYQKYGEKVIYMRNLKCTNKLLALAKYVHSETHKWKGFLRFQEMENHFYYAEFEPINDILELLAPHFKTRFQREDWLIKDVKRKKYAFKNENQLFFPIFKKFNPNKYNSFKSTRVVVVPSPTISFVFKLASLAISKIALTVGSSLSIFLAIVTPSLVIKGGSSFGSTRTFTPEGPSVTAVVSHNK